MTKIVFLVSSNGGTLKFLNEYIKLYHLNSVSIQAVIGDRQCKAIEYADKNGISNKVVFYNKGNKHALFAELELLDPDIIVTNIFKILDDGIVNRFRGKLINFHYSLLPSFKGHIGVSTIKEAIKLNCQFIGSTCHLVDELVDNGKIIGQTVFQINKENDELELSNIMFRSNCIMALNILVSFNNLDYSKSSQIEILNKTIMFSPILNKSLKIPDEHFWEKIKTL